MWCSPLDAACDGDTLLLRGWSGNATHGADSFEKAGVDIARLNNALAVHTAAAS